MATLGLYVNKLTGKEEGCNVGWGDVSVLTTKRKLGATPQRDKKDMSGIWAILGGT